MPHPLSSTASAAVISLCGQRQQLRRALELVAEMRSRGVPANVHTYSALMNVCCKCGELELALDVYDQLQVRRWHQQLQSCTLGGPNLTVSCYELFSLPDTSW